MVRLKKHNLILLLLICIILIQANSYSQNPCEISDSIRYYFQRFSNESNDSDYQQLSLLLSVNELLGDSKCYFPRDSDSKILYQAIDKIAIDTYKDVNAIEFFLNYDCLSLRNVELSEFISQDIIPKIAFQNTFGFLIALQKFDSDDRKKIVGDLEYLKGNEELKQIESNLKKIKNKKFKEIKQVVLNELEEIKH